MNICGPSPYREKDTSKGNKDIPYFTTNQVLLNAHGSLILNHVSFSLSVGGGANFYVS